MTYRRSVVIVLSALLVMGATEAVAAPSNDDFADAQVLKPGDFDGYIDRATLERGEPQPSCATTKATAWFSYTVASSAPNVSVSIQTSSVRYIGTFDPILAVYTGDTLTALDELSCTSGEDSFLETHVTAHGGETLFLQLGALGETEGSIYFNIAETKARSNDAFREAVRIESFPFKEKVNLRGAQLESGEPQPSCGRIQSSVWYQLRPKDFRIFAGNEPVLDELFVTAFYTGASLANLTERECDAGDESSGSIVRRERSDTTYWVQFGAVDDDPSPITFVAEMDEPCQSCPPPCADAAFVPMGHRAPRQLQWHFNPSGMPAGLGRGQVIRAIKGTISTINRSKNDCGIRDTTRLRLEYKGVTTRNAGSCDQKNDGFLVIQFAPLDDPIAGLACPHVKTKARVGRSGLIVRERFDADVLLQNRIKEDVSDPDGVTWTVSPESPECFSATDLQSIITHEFGHVMGLDHPNDTSNLTMDDGIGEKHDNSACSAAMRTLGRGDMKGLSRLY